MVRPCDSLGVLVVLERLKLQHIYTHEYYNPIPNTAMFDTTSIILKSSSVYFVMSPLH